LLARRNPCGRQRAAAQTLQLRKLETHMMLIGPAQAQVPGAPPDISLWDILVADPSFVVMSLVPIAILAVALLIVRRRYARFFSSETLAQINTMNRTLARIADRLDRAGGPAA
jgi:hypothetical protein